MAPRHPAQPDLLEWQPPETVVAFEPAHVRAATVAASIARAVAATLRDCGQPRDEVAERMSGYLGERVSKAMLDAYASEARREHAIPVTRLIALMHATGDRRLLQLIAEPMGWAVIERRHLPLIEVAAIREKEDELRRTREQLMREARKAGGA